MKNKTVIFSALLGLLLFTASCTKEPLGPVYDPGTPMFFVETEMKGSTLKITSGQNEFIAVPKVEKATILRTLLSLYTSTFTNGNDSFRVGFMAVQPPWIAPITSEEELNKTLEYAQANPKTLFVEVGGVGINWKIGNKTYTSPADADLQKGSDFTIIKVEDYTPPGADHDMKKLYVTFRCYMQNYDNPDDNFWLENGRATLLLDYQAE